MLQFNLMMPEETHIQIGQAGDILIEDFLV